MLSLLRTIVIFSIAVSSLPGTARIEEISSIEQLPSKAASSQSQVFIFDIDNTLYHPEQMLGSDEWFDSYLKQQITRNGNSQETVMQTVRLWQAIQTVTGIVPMEERTCEIIRSLQNGNCCVMAMTTRGPEMSITTLRQLASLNIDMRTTAPSKTHFQIYNMPDVEYNSGILFTNDRPKGTVLLEFLRQSDWSPTRIVYINDKIKPLEDVSAALPETIEFLGLRYAKADDFVKRFSAPVADRELAAFRNILSDQKAQNKTDGSPSTHR